LNTRNLILGLAGVGALALLFMRKKTRTGYSKTRAIRTAPLAADAVAIGEDYRDYPDRVEALLQFQTAAGIDADGLYGPTSRGALVYWLGEQGIDASRAPPTIFGNGTKAYSEPLAPSSFQTKRYVPHSPEAIALFEKGARRANVPVWWASEPGLHNILDKESDGYVGRPNYTYGDRARDESEWGGVLDELRQGQITATSSATGLGQLLLRNVDKYYPSGRNGLGDPVEEAAGMLAYIKDRYGDPANAWASYGKMGFEGY
jgi:hypothetical protein